MYPHRDDDAAIREVASLVDLLGLRDSERRVLDLACGTGRHAAALAGAGLSVTGLDLSSPLIAGAARRPELAGRLVRGDMRWLSFGAVFDVVLNLFTSFGYFSDEDNAATLREMARVLVPGGTLVIDHVNRSALEQGIVAEDSRTGTGFRLRQRRSIRDERVRKDITITWDDGSEMSFREDVRLYTPDELSSLFAQMGLSTVRFYGYYDGREFRCDSKRMLAVGRKGCSDDGR